MTGQPLKKDDVYSIIFSTDKVKFELSSDGKRMRRTDFDKSGGKIEEQTHIRVVKGIKKKVERSEKWKKRKLSLEETHIIYEQRDADNQATGFYRVRQKSDKKEMFFERGRQKE